MGRDKFTLGYAAKACVSLLSYLGTLVCWVLFMGAVRLHFASGFDFVPDFDLDLDLNLDFSISISSISKIPFGSPPCGKDYPLKCGS